MDFTGLTRDEALATVAEGFPLAAAAHEAGQKLADHLGERIFLVREHEDYGLAVSEDLHDYDQGEILATLLPTGVFIG